MCVCAHAVQPKITYLKNQTTSELEEQTVLTCEATGDPTPSIVWSFGRRNFSEEEQVLGWQGLWENLGFRVQRALVRAGSSVVC